MKKKVILILLVLLAIITFVPIPQPIRSNIEVNRIDNATNLKEEVAVKIDGIYYKYLILNDIFRGRFVVEGLEDIKTEVNMSFQKDKEANMNLSDTNQPVYRLVQKNIFNQFAICISLPDEGGRERWADDYGLTITTFDSITDVMKFLQK